MTARQRHAERAQWLRLIRGLERMRVKPRALTSLYHRAWGRGFDLERSA